MRLAQLITGLGLQLASGPEDAIITDLTDDSRRVKPGYLFIARAGAKEDGRQYVEQAVTQGAAAILAPALSMAVPDHVAVLQAKTVTQALAGEVAEFFFGHPSRQLKLIGVTGTKGKTTITFIMQQMLAAAGMKCGLIGTVYIDDGVSRTAAEVTTPGAIDFSRHLAAMVRHGCKAAVAEFSSHALHQGRVAALQTDVAVFTNLSGEHLDYHGTMDEYARAKAILFESLPPEATAVVNCEDERAQGMVRNCAAQVIGCRLWNHGETKDTPEQGADIADAGGTGTELHGEAVATILELAAGFSRARFSGPWGEFRASLRMIGRHNVMNALEAVTAVWRVTGMGSDSLRGALESCASPPGRLEPVVIGRDHPTVLVDYAHTFDPLEKTLQSLRALTKGKLICMFGCGGDRDRTKRPVMAQVACREADEVIITSDNPRTEDPGAIIDEILAGVPNDTAICDFRQATFDLAELGCKRLLRRRAPGDNSGPRAPAVMVQPDRAAAIQLAVAIAEKDDVVLLAGKGHETYQIIGVTKRDFDDREHASEALRQWKQARASSYLEQFWTPREFQRVLGGRWVVEPTGWDDPIRGLSIDSRQLQTGQAYVAIRGERFDGHDFVKDVVAKGANVVIVGRAMDTEDIAFESAGVLRVDDTLEALQKLARAYRDVLREAGTQVIGVVGSNGKTTTRHLIHAVLSTEKRGTQSPKSFNNHIGVPLTLLASALRHPTVDSATGLEGIHVVPDDFVVVEMGTNHPGEITTLARIVRPDVLVMTSIGHEHMAFFNTLETVAAEECSAFAHVEPHGLVLLPGDEPGRHLVEPHLNLLPRQVERVWFGGRAECDWRLVDYAASLAGLRGTALVRSLVRDRDQATGTGGTEPPGQERIQLAAPLLGRHNAINVMAAIAVGRWFGLDLVRIHQTLAQVEPAAMRGQVQPLPCGNGQATILNDAYNANPDSVAAALRTLAELENSREGGSFRRVVILGDMLELGCESPDLHRKVGRVLGQMGDRVGLVVLIGKLSMFTAEALLKEGFPPDQLLTFSSWSDGLPAQIAALFQPGDLILIKASRGMGLERLIPATPQG